MNVIEFQGVTKSFRTGRPTGIKDLLLGSNKKRHQTQKIDAVKDLSFTIEKGEVVALLGHNGSGKSTTLKLLAGTIHPDKGTVNTQGRIAPLLELGAGFHPDLTGRENIYLNAAFIGVPKAYVRDHLEEIIEFSGLGNSIDTPVRFYSSGMYARLGFSIAVHVEPEIVLIDEVLAVGDSDFQVKSLERMNQLKIEGRTLILVTHSLESAIDFCERAIVLNSGQGVFDGHVEEAEEFYLASTRG